MYHTIACHTLYAKVGVSFEGIHILKKKVVAVDKLVLYQSRER